MEVKGKRKTIAEFFHINKRAHLSSEGASSSGDTSVPYQHDATSNVAGTAADPLLLTPPNNVGNIDPPKMTPAEKAWNGLKAILPIVEKVSVAFPPLQSAIGGFIAVISKFDVRIIIGTCLNITEVWNSDRPTRLTRRKWKSLRRLSVIFSALCRTTQLGWIPNG